MAKQLIEHKLYKAAKSYLEQHQQQVNLSNNF